MFRNLVFLSFIFLIIGSSAFAIGVDEKSAVPVEVKGFVAESFILIKELTRNIFYILASEYKPFYYLLVVLGLIFVLGNNLIRGYPDLKQFYQSMFLVLIIGSIVFRKGGFDFFYEPIMNLILDLNKLFLRVASRSIPVTDVRIFDGSIANSSELLGSFANSINEIIEYTHEIGNNAGFFTKPIVALELLIIRGLTWVLLAYAIYKYAVIFIIMHMYLMAMPITISMLPFDRVKGIAFNNLKAFMTYAVASIFITIVFAMVIALFGGIYIHVDIKYGTVEQFSKAFGIILVFLLVSIMLISMVVEVASALFVGSVSSFSATGVMRGVGKVASKFFRR